MLTRSRISRLRSEPTKCGEGAVVGQAILPAAGNPARPAATLICAFRGGVVRLDGNRLLTSRQENNLAADKRETRMNADNSLASYPRSSVFIRGSNSFTASDGRGSAWNISEKPERDQGVARGQGCPPHFGTITDQFFTASDLTVAGRERRTSRIRLRA